MRAQFPAGREDRVLQHDEPAVPLERAAHDDLFCAEVGFIEATDDLKCAARAEDEASGSQTEGAKRPDSERHHHLPVPRHIRIETHSRTAADCALPHRVKGRANDSLVHDRVGIHKDEELSRCLSRT